MEAEKRKKIITAVLLCAALFAAAVAAAVICGLKEGSIMNTNEYDPNALVKPETWALTDGLGRSAPLKGEVKERDGGKFVGLFYWTWHTLQAEGNTARNVTQLLERDPDAVRDFDSPLWEGLPSGTPHFWDEPVYGYYLDTDEYVLRKQAELIADAGVDVIIFDCTNETQLWKSSYEKLFEVFEKAKADGIRVPKIAFMLPFWDKEYNRTDLINLYNDIYSKDRYRDLWFFWDEKPLVMGRADSLHRTEPLDREIRDFFTFRAGEPKYFTADMKLSEKRWGWCSDYPQAAFGVSGDGIEQMCVSVAQNAADGALVAMNADANVQGRGFSKDGYFYTYDHAGKRIIADSAMPEAYKYGLNFQQQWDHAIARDPELIFVTGWNEWVAGRWEVWEGTENAFPDQFNYEFSRDCEPSAGVLKDYYYCQLVENIRRFKGISDDIEEKDGVKIYHHYTDSVTGRSHAGWGDLYYENHTLRNDFTKAEVCDDGTEVTMRIYTKDPVSPRTGSAWMRVFVDTDPTDVSPNWEGFEYVINRGDAGDEYVTVERSTGGWAFETSGMARYSVDGNVMTLRIPFEALGLEKDRVSFRFKLSDNMQTDGDIMDFYLNGDVAPGGRFTFVYDSGTSGVKKESSAKAGHRYFTMSFDDGITQDRRIMELFRKHGLRSCTFFINTGLLGVSWDWVGDAMGKPGLSHLRFTGEELRDGVYDGFDVAVHTLTHPSLKDFDDKKREVVRQVRDDAENIAGFTGIMPKGMAWPGGDGECTRKTIDIILENTDIRFARGISSTNGFGLPDDFMLWQPSCSITDANVLDLAREFLETEPDKDLLFYVWGHGYELDAYDRYGVLDELLGMMSAAAEKGEVVPVTNTQFYKLFAAE